MNIAWHMADFTGGQSQFRGKRYVRHYQIKIFMQKLYINLTNIAKRANIQRIR